MHISVTPRHMFKGRNFASLETTCDVTDMCIRGGKRKEVDFSPLRRALFLPTRIDDRQVFRVPGDLLALSLSHSVGRSVGRRCPLSPILSYELSPRRVWSSWFSLVFRRSLSP